ncbi:hypothetical protein FKR81_21690 [Lentzea tibetensis]|uniref:Uncharacterized protein n=1 Tax=Lentzea tibetensis TaxID=2591470 RepID=A0A563ERM6_9PSEU|nr:hypothetical protein [Lentzea tibetensis]TWP50310.1 hypothetical protein FKR81_21690 [Lentzea tibetensis]
MIIRAIVVALAAATFAAVPAHAAPHPFSDSFEGAVNAEPTYGLNDNLKQRQGSGAVTYTRLSGETAAAQVNSKRHPGKLSLGSAVVRLDAPSTGSTISATLTPAAGSSSIVLSESANSTGDVSAQDIGLAFVLRANGGVQVVQPGQPAQTFDRFAKPCQDGSYRVTVTLTGSTLSLTVNDVRKDVALGTAVPTERLWTYLGHSGGDRAGLVDDLRMSSMNSSDLRKRDPRLRYHGFDVATAAQLAAVKGHSNLNRVRADLVKGCAPASCVVEATGANWQQQVRPHLSRVAAFSVPDAAAARSVKKAFPDKKVLLVVPGAQVDDAFTAPAEADWVGFSEACLDYGRLETLMTKLEERVPDKELFLLPEGSPVCPEQTDETVMRTQYMYLEMTQYYPRYVGLLVTGPWQPVRHPLTADAQERVAAVVLGDAR